MPDTHPHPWHHAPDIASLSPDSYTAQRLVSTPSCRLPPSATDTHSQRHATPDHLHLTSRRFFIGPIPVRSPAMLRQPTTTLMHVYRRDG
jgi:hypothetical protein